VDDFPYNKQDREGEYHEIAEQECGDIPEPRKEDGIATNERENEAHNKGIICAIWLPERFVWKRIAADALDLKRFLEFEVGEAHDAEVDELRCSDLWRLVMTNNGDCRI